MKVGGVTKFSGGRRSWARQNGSLNLWDYPSALNEPDDENNHGSYEQEVYVPGDDVKANPADEPSQEQDHKDCPQHVG